MNPQVAIYPTLGDNFVLHYDQNVRLLKKHSVLFDTVYSPFLTAFLSTGKQRFFEIEEAYPRKRSEELQRFKDSFAELEFLRDEQVIADIPVTAQHVQQFAENREFQYLLAGLGPLQSKAKTFTDGDMKPSGIRERRDMRESTFREEGVELMEREAESPTPDYSAVFEEINRRRQKALEDEAKRSLDAAQRVREAFDIARPLMARLNAIVVSSVLGVDAIPCLSLDAYERPVSPAGEQDVLHLVLSKLPLPAAQTRWTDILEFRNDPDLKHSILGLRRWMRKVAGQSLSKQEIAEEIEWLMEEFRRHTELHKLKARTTAIEALIKIPFEVLENLLTLRWSKLLEPLLVLRKHRIQLLEAESNAPGRELCYLVKAGERFRGKT